MKTTTRTIYPSLFVEYSTCPAWIYHDKFTDPKLRGEIPELALKLMEQGVVHERDYVKDLPLESLEELGLEDAIKQTKRLMEQGVERIYQGAIRSEINGDVWYGRPDLLEKFPAKSNLGDYLYVPVDIKSSTDIKPNHKLQLAFYAKILEQMQGKLPASVAIINKKKERIGLALESEIMEKLYEKVNRILEILDGRKPTLHYKGSCKQSPWGKMCLEDCQKVNDIALVYNITDSALEKLRSGGIETIPDLAKQNSEIPQFKIAEKTWERIVLQAQSLMEDKLIWKNKEPIPTSDYKIYFDIEGDPLLEMDYLFGFWLGDEKQFKYFLAEKPEHEEKMWREFLAWLTTLPKDYIVYHYAPYEKIHLDLLEKRYGGSKELDFFREKLVDLFATVKDSVIFPLYFYSVKDIAKSRFVNYKWRHQKAGGAQSIFWYEQWLETGDKKILQDIIDYNEDDVIATEHLYKWLVEQMA